MAKIHSKLYLEQNQPKNAENGGQRWPFQVSYLLGAGSGRRLNMSEANEPNNVVYDKMGKALRTATYILNQVPSKSIPKTPYELWLGKKPSLRYFHVWGCKAEVRPYNM